MSDRHAKSPPRLAEKLFSWYCCQDLAETILGDLHEKYLEDIHRYGAFQANLSYWKNVFLFINQYTLRRSKKIRQNSNFNAMFKNYLRVTLRSLRKHTAYSTINVSGLALGLASCMIIFFYVKKELSFDRFHVNSDRLYRVTNTFERSGNISYWGRTPPALAPALRDNFPSVEKVTRLREADDHLYTIGDRSFYENNVFFADSLFLEMFDFPLMAGDRNTALDGPGNVVLTPEIAFKFFGEEDPLGKLITFDNQRSLKVTGILEPIPTNSHLTFDILISFSTFTVPQGYLANLNSWGWAGFWTYVQLSEKADYKVLEAQVDELYQENFRDRPDLITSVVIQPLREVYLGSSHYTNLGKTLVGNRSTIYGLSIIAGLILIVAGFNFTNLSTAMSLSRGKEIGVRKVMGAAKSRIAFQFLLESIVISILSWLVAMFIVIISGPYFSNYLNIELPGGLEHLFFAPLFLTVTIVIGFIAGIYPSIILSAFSPILALRGSLKTGASGVWLRKALITLQFAISIGLISGSLVVLSQMKFIQDKSLGFEQENVLKIRLGSEDMLTYYEAIKNKFLQNPHVEGISPASHPFDGTSSSGPAWLKGASEEDAHQMAYYQTGHDFLEVTGIDLLEGRYFSRDFPNDTATALVLNEAAVKELDLVNPLGQRVNFHNRERIVVGVVEDFHFSSLHTPIGPMGIVMPFVTVELILLKINEGDVREILASLENDWKEVTRSVPFEVAFLDDGIQAMYEKEEQLSSLITIFSFLAMILACLGLYGLVAFSINARLKEVGIRKVLGASVSKIVYTLSRNFMILVLIGNLIAWPITWYFAEGWLNDFAYSIEMKPMIFVFSGALLLLISILTISQQTIKAALTNPVDVLRDE